MSRELILALDAGTQSTRAIVFDPRGNLLAKSRIPHAPYVSPRPARPPRVWPVTPSAARVYAAASRGARNVIKK